MAEVTWKDLAKTVTDKTKIDEEIDNKIKTHNEDPSAHKQSGEAIDAHRTAEILDHLDKSIRAPKLHSSAQVGDVVVAPEGGDYTDIQSALDAGNKSIFVKKGTYEITSAILVLNSGVTIRGESWTNTIIKIANWANCNAIEVGNGSTAVSDFSISDIQIDGNDVNQTSGGYGIYFYGASGYLITNSKIESCKIMNCYNYGIYLNYSNNNIVAGNQANLNDSGIYLYYSNNNAITGNQAKSNDYGIYLDHADNNTITGNQVSSNDYGVYLENANYNTVVGNQANSNSEGISIYSANYNTVVGNQANSNSCCGIYLSSASYNTVVGNQADSNEDGINLAYANNNTVIGNQADSNSDDGISLGYADYNTIVGNRCTGNSQYGIDITDSNCDNNYVRLNYLTGNTTGSFNDAGTGTIIAASTTNDNVI